MPRTRIPRAFEVVIPPGPASSASRLAVAIVRVIAEGRLHDGDPLPSTRTLAVETGVARSTVVAAYEELAAGGFVEAKAGSMTRVAVGAEVASKSGADEPEPKPGPRRSTRPGAGRARNRGPAYDLTPGSPDATLIDARSWGRAWRSAEESARVAGPHALELKGVTRHDDAHFLRTQLCAHLRRHRGIDCDPDQLFLFPALDAASAAVIEVLGLACGLVAVEEPGSVRARTAFAAAGCRLHPCAVDEHGLRVTGLTGRESLVHVTPAHQVPLGADMPPERRDALVAWAYRCGALILEDDFDGVFRFDHDGPASLRETELGKETVIHMGAISRLLTPALKIAWIVVPEWLQGRLHRHRLARGEQVCGVSAHALAEFIRSGALTDHLVRSRRTYEVRRRAFVEECTERLPRLDVLGDTSGPHLVLGFERGLDDVRIVRDLQRQGLACLPLSPFYASGAGIPTRSGLVCGHHRLHERLAAGAVTTIAETLERFREH